MKKWIGKKIKNAYEMRTDQKHEKETQRRRYRRTLAINESL